MITGITIEDADAISRWPSPKTSVKHLSQMFTGCIVEHLSQMFMGYCCSWANATLNIWDKCSTMGSFSL